MPRRMAAFGEVISTRSPSIRISPWSGLWTPERILISVDLPAPLSPTRPTTSRDWRSKFTPLRACTPAYHLCMSLTAMNGAVILSRHFHPTRRSAQPSVGYDCEYRQAADGEFKPIGVDLAHHQAVVDDADQESADDGAQHRSDAAGERGPANNRGGDRLQLESVPNGWQR